MSASVPDDSSRVPREPRVLCQWALATLSRGLISSGCRSKKIRLPPQSAVVVTGAVASAIAMSDKRDKRDKRNERMRAMSK